MNGHALLEHIAEQAHALGVLSEKKFTTGSPKGGPSRRQRKRERGFAKKSAKRQKRRERARSKGKGEGTPGSSKATQWKPTGRTMVTPGVRSTTDKKVFTKPAERTYPVADKRAQAAGSLRAASANRGGDGRFRDGGSETSTYKDVLAKVKSNVEKLAMHRKDDNYRGFRDQGSGLSVGGKKVTKGSPVATKPKSKGSKARKSASDRGKTSRGETRRRTRSF